MAELQRAAQAQQLVPLAEDEVLVDPPPEQRAGAGEPAQIPGWAEAVETTARMSDLAGLDPSRLRLWLFARCVQESPDWPTLADIAVRIAP